MKHRKHVKNNAHTAVQTQTSLLPKTLLAFLLARNERITLPPRLIKYVLEDEDSPEDLLQQYGHSTWAGRNVTIIRYLLSDQWPAN